MRAAFISLILLQLGCAGPGEPQANYTNPSIVRLLSKACAGDSDNLGGFDLSPDELNSLGNDGAPPLLWLLMNCEDSQETSSTLIRMGADPHLYSSSQKNSPARFAIRNLPPSYLKAMLEAGMNPNYRYEQYADSPTLLFLAVMHRDEEKVEDLLSHGAFIEERNASGDTPLLYIRANQWAIGRMLLSEGADASAVNHSGHGICYRLKTGNYTPPNRGPDHKRLFTAQLQSKGIDCKR